MKIVLVVLAVLAIIILPGCGVSQREYDKVVAENMQLKYDVQTSVDAFDKLLDNSRTFKYFQDKDDLRAWLDTLTIVKSFSADGYDWYIRGLYIQQTAVEDHYIISVSHEVQNGRIVVLCEAVTQDGHVYCFDPDYRDDLFDCGFKLQSEFLGIGMN